MQESPIWHLPARDSRGLESLVADIGDRADNITRFHIVGRALLARGGRDKTTISMSIADMETPGALHRLLEPLARYGVSMEGHAAGPAMPTALEELAQTALLFEVLGAYRCGVWSRLDLPG